ncbi:MAG: hypothetical protein P8P56_01635 [Yoonia sp.]|nr:hypothetical protein [Yoonia sp.]MDG1864156.1 hypothetical protein [Yoonia sp.]
MSTTTLTKTRLYAGVWEGVLTGAGTEPPKVRVTHMGDDVDGVQVKDSDDVSGWLVHVPVPAHLMSDGVQTFLITNADTGETLNSFTLLFGEVLAEDIRAEMSLLREELDLLKSAFRRHCVETS